MTLANKFTATEVAFVRDNYDSMTVKEMARALGVKYCRVRNLIYRFGIKRSEAGIAFVRKHHGHSLHKTIESEKRRILWGMGQLTNRWVNVDGWSKTQSRRHLCHKYGFWINPQDHDEFFYEKDMPLRVNERLMYKRYGFRFTAV